MPVGPLGRMARPPRRTSQVQIANEPSPESSLGTGRSGEVVRDSMARDQIGWLGACCGVARRVVSVSSRSAASPSIQVATGPVGINVSGAPIGGAGRVLEDRERLLAVLRDVRLTEGRRSRDLAAGLHAAIMSGELRVGAKLPPQRELALLLSVGRTTVVTAYNLLRGESLIEMTQGAGTWVADRSESPTGDDAWWSELDRRIY